MTKLVDINPDHANVVQEILRKNLPSGVAVWVFGSRADWTTKDYSDLDLALEGYSALDQSTIVEIKTAFEESDLPYKVDIIDLNQVSDSFRQIVEDRKIFLISTFESKGSDGPWSALPFGDCAKLVRDEVLPADLNDVTCIGVEHIGEGTISLIGNGNASNVSGIKGRFRHGDILFGILHPYRRRIARADFDGLCSADVWVVRPTGKADADYLLYVMASKDFASMVMRYSEGTKMSRIKWESVSRCRIPVPPLRDQRTIASILKRLDSKIELNRRMNQTLEEMGRVLFKSWFVDFEPVRAKIEGRWHSGKPLSGLSDYLYNIIPNQFTDSDLGKIPYGWTVNTLKNHFNLTMGKSPPRYACNEEGDGLPFVDGGANFGLRYPKGKKHCRAPTRLAYAGSTLVSLSDPIGAVNIAWEKCGIGKGIAALRHRTGSESFTYYMVRSRQRDLKQCEEMKASSGAITKKHLEMMTTVEPPAGVIDYFDSCVSAWNERIRISTLESRSLMHQRDALLTKLISMPVKPER